MSPRKFAEFLAKIRIDPNGCWTWIGFREGNGYPRLYMGRQEEQYAHRTSYRYFIGPIPEELELDHLCRNRSCVNPTHLEAVTRLVNIRRGANAIKTECKNGHPFVPGSFRLESGPRGLVRRRCVLCKAAYDKVYHAVR